MIIDVEAARAAIARIHALDLSATSVEEIRELLTSVFRGYRVEAPRFEPGLLLFRGRVFEKPEKPTNIGELSYPPASKVKFGRVNRPLSPVFYCCTSREAPFFELAPPVGTTMALSRWLTTSPMLVNQVGYVEPTFRALGSARKQAGWGARPAQIPPGPGNADMAMFLSEAFTRRILPGDENHYKLTVAIAERLCDGDLFDGLLYPTVAMRANADNLALKPRYSDRRLRFVKAEFVRIDAVKDFTSEITILDTATELSGDGTIQWKGHGDRWTIRTPGGSLVFTAENREWVARSPDGAIVQPD